MKPEEIVVHNSASRFGTASIIDRWHRERGWKMIGYHAVIMNGFPDATYAKRPMRVKLYNGVIEIGRVLDVNGILDADEIGAHALGHNAHSLGVCLIGGTDSSGHFEPFTRQQVIGLVKLCRLWQFQFDIPTEKIVGHNELPGVTKACPEISMDTIRALVRNKVESQSLFREFGSQLKEDL